MDLITPPGYGRHANRLSVAATVYRHHHAPSISMFCPLVTTMRFSNKIHVSPISPTVTGSVLDVHAPKSV